VRRVILHQHALLLPADLVEGLAGLYDYRDFAQFIEVWVLTTGALRTERDFSQVVVDYAAEAASHGAVYIEGIFTPAEPAGRGCDWDEVFTGYCDGAQQAAEQHGVQVRLTPDIPRGYPLEMAELTARYAVAYRDRGVVGIGLGGPEAEYPPEAFAWAFEIARDGGLGSVPHAGEAAGPASIRGALDSLHANRIRHGIRAAEDPGPHRSSRLAGRASATRAGSGRHRLLSVHRRSGDVRNRPSRRRGPMRGTDALKPCTPPRRRRLV
jgi:aminodeoxyfutalosine deaminase